MTEPRLLGGGVGMPRDHRLVPMFDLVRGMLGGIFSNPFQDRVVFLQATDGLLESVTVDLEKAEQMLVEPDGLVVVTVEQTFAVQLGLVDQARQMDVTAELFVRTARMQSSHDSELSC